MVNLDLFQIQIAELSLAKRPEITWPDLGSALCLEGEQLVALVPLRADMWNKFPIFIYASFLGRTAQPHHRRVYKWPRWFYFLLHPLPDSSTRHGPGFDNPNHQETDQATHCALPVEGRARWRRKGCFCFSFDSDVAGYGPKPRLNPNSWNNEAGVRRWLWSGRDSCLALELLIMLKLSIIIWGAVKFFGGRDAMAKSLEKFAGRNCFCF